MKIKDDSWCTDCKDNNKESLLHFYWECRRLWEHLKEIIDLNTKIKLTLSPEDSLSGIAETPEPVRQRKRLVTTLCLLTKHYIHLCKCSGDNKNIFGLRDYIKRTYYTEKTIAHQGGTEHLLDRKWGDITEWLVQNRG